MHRRVHVLLLTVVAIALPAGTASGGESDLWPGLTSGSYTVGYRVAHLRDPSRSSSEQPDVHRPVQVSVWYPASGEKGGKPVIWRDYFLSAATETDFSEPDDARRVRHLEDVREAAIGAGADDEEFERLLGAATTARRDAPPAKGPFPLVVFVPGMGAPAFQNTVACEYLASRGFVVASFPSAGRNSREMTEDEAGVTAQVGDVEFVIRSAPRLAPVDRDHVGLAGYSWGGLTATFAAMRGAEVDALVAIDPTFMVRRGHELARTLEGYDPGGLRIPVMMMIAAAKQWKERDVTFVDELSGTEATLLRFHAFKHGDFASAIVRFFVHTLPDGGGRDIEKIDAGYAAECRYLAAFFDAHLRADGKSVAWLASDPGLDGVSVERK